MGNLAYLVAGRTYLMDQPVKPNFELRLKIHQPKLNTGEGSAYAVVQILSYALTLLLSVFCCVSRCACLMFFNLATYR
jgi:hypothetical protein